METIQNLIQATADQWSVVCQNLFNIIALIGSATADTYNVTSYYVKQGSPWVEVAPLCATLCATKHCGFAAMYLFIIWGNYYQDGDGGVKLIKAKDEKECLSLYNDKCKNEFEKLVLNPSEIPIGDYDGSFDLIKYKYQIPDTETAGVLEGANSHNIP